MPDYVHNHTQAQCNCCFLRLVLEPSGMFGWPLPEWCGPQNGKGLQAL